MWGKHGACIMKSGIYLREGDPMRHRVGSNVQEFRRVVIFCEENEVTVPLSHIEEILSSARVNKFQRKERKNDE